MNKFQTGTFMDLKPDKSRQSQQREPNYATAKKQTKNRERDTSATRKQGYGRQQRMREPSSNNRKLSKAEIKQLYENLMNQSEYTQAQNVNATIKYMNVRERERRKRRLSEEHSMQKDAVKASHQNQMKFFREAWREMFMEQAMKQRMMMQRLDRMRRIDEEECKERITRRCQSAKPAAVISKLYEIEEVQNLLRKRGKTTVLRRIRDQKKNLVSKAREQQEQNLIRIAEEQKRRMTEKQTRRYRSFMHRIERDRRDNDRIYRREEQKLKQKYKNILRNLEHEQKKDVYQLDKSFRP